MIIAYLYSILIVPRKRSRRVLSMLQFVESAYENWVFMFILFHVLHGYLCTMYLCDGAWCAWRDNLRALVFILLSPCSILLLVSLLNITISRLMSTWDVEFGCISGQ